MSASQLTGFLAPYVAPQPDMPPRVLVPFGPDERIPETAAGITLVPNVPQSLMSRLSQTQQRVTYDSGSCLVDGKSDNED